MSLAAALGQFAADSDWASIPMAVRNEAHRSILNGLGCATGSATDPAISTLLDVLPIRTGGVTVIGRAEQLDRLDAAFVNAIGINLMDYDDTHLATVIHPTAPVLPAALALAEQRDLPGAALLHAFVLGMEVACRLGLSVSPDHYARGWHITATCGGAGAAAACAKLLGLDAARTAHAIGIAVNVAGGFVENLPHGAKNVGVGNAARNGLLAALLAERGYTAAPGTIEGRLGWGPAMGVAPNLAVLLDGLGTQWEVLKNAYKPYPCGVVMHAVVDAGLAVRQAAATETASIVGVTVVGVTVSGVTVVGVTVSGSRLLLERGDRATTNSRDARVSIAHCVAVALLFGKAGLREFSEAVVADPAVAALRRLVTAKLDPAAPVGSATVSVRYADGRTHEATVVHARGSLMQPLSDLEIEAKAAELMGSPDAAARLAHAVWALDGSPTRTLAPLIGRAG
jgi:2-methylcitrate dehydratase PrpD